jgi:ferredoxin
VRIVQSGEEYSCRASETLLSGMARLGRKSIPAGCLSGGCGVCKVAVRKGRWHKSGPMSRAHVSEEEEAQGIALACRIVPDEDLEVEVIGKMQGAVLSK